MDLDLHYTHPLLVDLYDIENPHGEDTDFYIALAERLVAQTIIDLGCGTGLLTRQLAVGDRQVIGIDPAAAMLDYAQKQTGAGRVRWIEGVAADLGQEEADLVVMTSHVAQVFLDDDVWLETLKALNHALKAGGHIAFESRNPAARAWESWTPEKTFYRFDSPHGPVESWLEVTDVQPGLVSMIGHNRFLTLNEELRVTSTLRFRSQEEIVASLNEAGFETNDTFGSWQQAPASADSHTMIFIGQKRG
ncbi:MAG: methyltransferase domain-containing protein [Chloroflexota bacterium]